MVNAGTGTGAQEDNKKDITGNAVMSFVQYVEIKKSLGSQSGVSHSGYPPDVKILTVDTPITTFNAL